jgi:tetratricopeptide (TPR) repeat protein
MDVEVSRAAEEEARSYEIMCWIDAFIDPRNMLLDSFKLLNFSERKGFSPGVVIAYAGIAAVAAIFGLYRISYRYGRMAIRIARETRHPGAIAYANQALVLTEFFQGKFLSAIEYGRVAAEASRQGGYWNLQGWGIDGYFISRSLACLGRFGEAIEYARDLARFGQDANDSEVCYWGLICLGSAQAHVGKFDKAAANLKEAVNLAERVPNHWYRVTAGSFLGDCYLRRGDIAQALAVLEQNRDYAVQHGIKGPVTYQNALAETYLLMGERTSGSDRLIWLGKARSACRAALRTGKRYVPRLLPDALRVQGLYSYISGNQPKARTLWQKGITMAEKGGMRFEAGLTHLEVGRRLKDRAHLEQAAAVFAEIGAEFNLSEAQNLLEAARR